MLPQIELVVLKSLRRHALNWFEAPATICGISICHLTARMRLQLELSGNAFVVAGKVADRHDVFAFLWRLNSAYTKTKRPELLVIKTRWHRCTRLIRYRFGLGNWRSAWAYDRLRLRVQSLGLLEAIRAVARYWEHVRHDRPAVVVDDKKEGILPKARLHWTDDLIFFFTTRHGMTCDEVLDTPLVQLYQLARVWAIETTGAIDDDVTEVAGDVAREVIANNRRAISAAMARN